MHPKSFVSNFWGAVHSGVGTLFCLFPLRFFALLSFFNLC